MQSLLLAKAIEFTSRSIKIFGFDIYYYAIVIVSGMIIAAILSALLMKRRNMSPDFIFTLFVVCIPTAIIGARLFYCLTDDSIGITEFFKFRDGGLAITGGVIGGVLAGFIVCLVSKVPFFRAADCVVVTILLAQAIGRWGNYFNQEVYGGVVENEALQFFPFSVFVKGQWHYALFFYEMVINLIGFALLYTYAWYRKKKPNGILMFLYFVWYGTVRMIMEPLRDPSYILDNGGIAWSQVFAVMMVGFGVIGCLVLMILNYKKEGAFVGSKFGDPYGISEYCTPYKKDKPYYSKINMFGSKYPPKPSKAERKKQQPPKESE